MGASVKSSADLLVRSNGPSADHGCEAQRKATDTNDPWVHDHEPVCESRHDHLPSSQGDDADSQASVKEGIVEVLPLKSRHTTIFSGLAVEHQVDRHQRSSKDRTTNKQPPRIRASSDGSCG